MEFCFLGCVDDMEESNATFLEEITFLILELFRIFPILPHVITLTQLAIHLQLSRLICDIWFQ